MIKLLLIEDDAKCARMVEKILEPHGFEVHHVATGLGGIQLARQITPALILLDMDLPDLNGKVVCVQLRTIVSKTTPVIAFTAENGAKAKRIALAFGCDDFISKPIDTRLFPHQLKQILNVPDDVEAE
jgi:DNA-binding response OmpR family regulator